MNIDIFSSNEDEPNPTMSKDDYILQAREFVNKVTNIYWGNWSYRRLNDDEYPEESQCDKCKGSCVIKIKDYEYDCQPNHEDGDCFIRVFDENNYSEEMGNLLETFDHMDLINPEIHLTDQPSRLEKPSA